MGTCVSLYNEHRYKSRITASQYIDPFGFEYQRSIVHCIECIFVGCGGCVLYKEEGLSDPQIEEQVQRVSHENFCDCFLIENFSEGDSADEEVKAEIARVSRQLDCPKAYRYESGKGNAELPQKKGRKWFLWIAIGFGLWWVFSG